MPARILIIDDDVELCGLLREFLGTEGYELEAQHRGGGAAARAVSGKYALVVLDVMLPEVNGFDILREIRRTSKVPVILLTARGDEVDRIVGLELGADDYLPKPFNPRELIARVRAILRRTSRVGVDGQRLTAGDIGLDPAAREAWINDRRLELTSAEFSLLEAFLRDAGRVVTRERLTEAVLGRKVAGPFDRVIDVHISNLRKKLGDAPAGERIKAVRGAGYLFVVRSGAKKK